MTAEEIAKRFDISLPAAQIRMAEIERIKRRASGVKRALPQSIVDFLVEAKRKGHVVKSLD